MLEMLDRFIPVSEEQISAFEEELRVLFPPQYKRFLLCHNGGRPKNCVFVIPGASGEDIVNFFYGIDTGNSYDLWLNRDAFAGRIPDGLLAIADDPCGNQICISLFPFNNGKIYFWDHELEFTPDRTIVLISNSFDEFIDGLREDT